MPPPKTTRTRTQTHANGNSLREQRSVSASTFERTASAHIEPQHVRLLRTGNDDVAHGKRMRSNKLSAFGCVCVCVCGFERKRCRLWPIGGIFCSEFLHKYRRRRVVPFCSVLFTRRRCYAAAAAAVGSYSYSAKAASTCRCDGQRALRLELDKHERDFLARVKKARKQSKKIK